MLHHHSRSSSMRSDKGTLEEWKNIIRQLAANPLSSNPPSVRQSIVLRPDSREDGSVWSTIERQHSAKSWDAVSKRPLLSDDPWKDLDMEWDHENKSFLPRHRVDHPRQDELLKATLPDNSREQQKASLEDDSVVLQRKIDGYNRNKCPREGQGEEEKPTDHPEEGEKQEKESILDEHVPQRKFDLLLQDEYPKVTPPNNSKELQTSNLEGASILPRALYVRDRRTEEAEIEIRRKQDRKAPTSDPKIEIPADKSDKRKRLQKKRSASDSQKREKNSLTANLRAAVFGKSTSKAENDEKTSETKVLEPEPSETVDHEDRTGTPLLSNQIVTLNHKDRAENSAPAFAKYSRPADALAPLLSNQLEQSQRDLIATQNFEGTSAGHGNDALNHQDENHIPTKMIEKWRDSVENTQHDLSTNTIFKDIPGHGTEGHEDESPALLSQIHVKESLHNLNTNENYEGTKKPTSPPLVKDGHDPFSIFEVRLILFKAHAVRDHKGLYESGTDAKWGERPKTIEELAEICGQFLLEVIYPFCAKHLSHMVGEDHILRPDFESDLLLVFVTPKPLSSRRKRATKNAIKELLPEVLKPEVHIRFATGGRISTASPIGSSCPCKGVDGGMGHQMYLDTPHGQMFSGGIILNIENIPYMDGTSHQYFDSKQSNRYGSEVLDKTPNKIPSKVKHNGKHIANTSDIHSGNYPGDPSIAWSGTDSPFTFVKFGSSSSNHPRKFADFQLSKVINSDSSRFNVLVHPNASKQCGHVLKIESVKSNQEVCFRALGKVYSGKIPRGPPAQEKLHGVVCQYYTIRLDKDPETSEADCSGFSGAAVISLPDSTFLAHITDQLPMNEDPGNSRKMSTSSFSASAEDFEAEGNSDSDSEFEEPVTSSNQTILVIMNSRDLLPAISLATKKNLDSISLPQPTDCPHCLGLEGQHFWTKIVSDFVRFCRSKLSNHQTRDVFDFFRPSSPSGQKSITDSETPRDGVQTQDEEFTGLSDPKIFDLESCSSLWGHSWWGEENLHHG